MRCVTFFADEIGFFLKNKRTQSATDMLNFNIARHEVFFKKIKRTQSATDKLNFNIARHEANTAKRNAIKRYEQKLVNKP